MKRSRPAIMLAILDTCRGEGASAATIARDCNLSSVQPYLNELAEAKLIETNGPLCQTTQKGITAAGLARASGLV